MGCRADNVCAGHDDRHLVTSFTGHRCMRAGSRYPHLARGTWKGRVLPPPLGATTEASQIRMSGLEQGLSVKGRFVGVGTGADQLRAHGNRRRSQKAGV